MENNTKEFNECLKSILNKFNYPCFHREINKVVFGKSEKGIREKATKRQKDRIYNLQLDCMLLITHECDEFKLMNYIKKKNQNKKQR